MKRIPKKGVIARLGDYALVKDKGGSASISGKDYFSSNLQADHFAHDGRLINQYDFGSGKVNESFVVGLAKDWQGTTNNKAAPIITQANRMYSGTSSTAEQAYDYTLGTPVIGGATTSVITPTFAVGSASNNTTVQWVGTITYSGTSAINEWGLFDIPNVATGPGVFYTTSTNTNTATTITPGGTPNWTANALAGWAVVLGASATTANQTGQTQAFIESNTGSALTIAQASNDGISYWTTSNNGGSAATPSNNTLMAIYPFMLDHKTFSTINVINGDSITFTYTLTIQSGG